MAPLGALCLIFEEDALVPAVRGSSNAFAFLKVDGTTRPSLYFHVGQSEVRNDEFAKERFEMGDPSSVGDFYDAVVDPRRTYSLYGVSNSAVTLAGPLLERIRDAWGQHVGSANASSAVRTFVMFAPGVADRAREVLVRYLRDKGFDVEGTCDYHEALAAGLHRKGLIGASANVAFVTASFGDLQFEYLELKPDAVKHKHGSVLGKGEDARVQVLAELIVNSLARKTSSQILNFPELLALEHKRFFRKARVLVDQFQYGELDIRETLSDGGSARVILDERDVNERVEPRYRFAQQELCKFMTTHSNFERIDRIVIACRALDSDIFASLLARAVGGGKLLRIAADLAAIQLMGLDEMIPAEAGTLRGSPAAPPAPATPAVAAAPVAPAAVSAPPATSEASTRAKIAPPPLPPSRGRPTPPAVAQTKEDRKPPALPPLPTGSVKARPTAPPLPQSSRSAAPPPSDKAPARPPLPGRTGEAQGKTRADSKPSAPERAPVPPPVTPKPATKPPPMPPPLPSSTKKR